MLPELGYDMQVLLGDMVFFLANQQLHRLDVDNSQPNATQVVLTLWTDALAMGVAKSSAHANPDFVPASALGGDLQSRYQVMEPNAEDDEE
jgi:hypothetical protein